MPVFAPATLAMIRKRKAIAERTAARRKKKKDARVVARERGTPRRRPAKGEEYRKSKAG